MYECYQCQACNKYDECPKELHHYCDDRNKCHTCEHDCPNYEKLVYDYTPLDDIPIDDLPF